MRGHTTNVPQVMDPRRVNSFTTNEQGDSPPFATQIPTIKKKVTISVEMNDILPMSHQRDALSDDDEEPHNLRDEEDEEEGSDKDKIDEGVLQDVIDDDIEDESIHM